MTKTRHKSCIPAMYMMSLPLLNLASVAQFPGLNFGFTAVNKQYLFICQNKYNVILLIRRDPGGLQMTTYPADDIVDISVSSARALLVLGGVGHCFAWQGTRPTGGLVVSVCQHIIYWNKFYNFFFLGGAFKGSQLRIILLDVL